MQGITLDQLRASANAGGVTGVTLKAQGGGFFMEIETRRGRGAILTKARSNEPRRFGNPASALLVLRELGIVTAKLDATNWDPRQKDLTQSRPQRARAMREAHKAAAYNEWLATEIQASINDPEPGIPHDEVMARLDARVAGLNTGEQ